MHFLLAERCMQLCTGFTMLTLPCHQRPSFNDMRDIGSRELTPVPLVEAYTPLI